MLTLRVTERMAGTIGVLSVYGDDWFGNARTAQRRRAELRKVGIEFVSDLAPGVRVDVGTVLHAACDAWNHGNREGQGTAPDTTLANDGKRKGVGAMVAA